MKKSTVKWRQKIIYLLLLFIGVNGLGYYGAGFYNRGGFVSAVSLGAPPGENVVFLSIEEDLELPRNQTVYIQSDTGLYKSTSFACEQESCWQAVTSTPSAKDYGSTPVVGQVCDNPSNLIIRSPNDLKSCISLFDEAGGISLVRYTYFMQMESGEILGWVFIPGSFAILIMATFFLLSLILLFLTVVVSFFVRRAKSSKDG